MADFLDVLEARADKATAGDLPTAAHRCSPPSVLLAGCCCDIAPPDACIIARHDVASATAVHAPPLGSTLSCSRVRAAAEAPCGA